MEEDDERRGGAWRARRFRDVLGEKGERGASARELCSESMCAGKKRYPSAEAAKRARNATWKYRRNETRCYRCPICHGYHLTSDK